jgi:hypothetical protein
MFPRALLVARVYKDQVRPTFLGEESVGVADSVKQLYARSIGLRRREVEAKVREVEGQVQRYKVIRALALLVDRVSTFKQREGPDPVRVREVLFDSSSEPAITPEERERKLGEVAGKLDLSQGDTIKQMWADLEEEAILTHVPDIDPHDLITNFNLGQCQTLLFKANHLTVSFEGQDAYKEAIRRIKRMGLMFTALPGPPPMLEVEGTLSFLHSTEKYGTTLAMLLPDLIALPGWRMEAKIVHTDAAGRRKTRNFILDSGVADYLGVSLEDAPPALPTPFLTSLIGLLDESGLKVTKNPPPLVVGGGMEFPDLVVQGNGRVAYVEEIGYWSLEWVKRKLLRTEKSPHPYLIVASRALAVTKSLEHPRFIAGKKTGLDLDYVRRKVLPAWFPATEEVEVGPSSLPAGVGDRDVHVISEIARSCGLRYPAAKKFLEERGYLCAWGFAIRRDALPRLREEVMGALPNLSSVEKVLERWSLSTAILPTLGLTVKWRGLEEATVVKQ